MSAELKRLKAAVEKAQNELIEFYRSLHPTGQRVAIMIMDGQVNPSLATVSGQSSNRYSPICVELENCKARGSRRFRSISLDQIVEVLS